MARRKGDVGRDLDPDTDQDEKGPDAVDVHVGARIRLRRTLLGMSQSALGEAVGLTFQQIQKYERGANRVSASRLWEFSQVLDVPPSFFFDDLPEGVANRTESVPVAADAETNVLAKRETLELVRAYYKIADPSVRKRMFELTKAAGRALGGGGMVEDAGG